MFAKHKQKIAALALAAAGMFETSAAHAVGAGGGGMPWDAGLTTLSQSIQGPVAGIIILIAVVCGVGAWIMGSQLEGLMKIIAQCIIGICVVGGVATFISAVGVAGGAMIA